MDLATLRGEINKHPFQPFALRLSDGTSVLVPHQEFIAIAPPRNVIVGREEGGYEVLDALHIVALDRTLAAQRRRRSRGNGK
jgi:hypothetical protein